MPRLFTGLEIPPAIVERLALYRGGLPGARWTEPSDHHLTLRFLGDVDTDTANAVHESLLDARPRTPITVALEGIDSFGGDKPRSVYAAVASNPELADLQEEHERIARRADLPPERRRFTPHVTLARLNGRVTAGSVAQYLAQTGVFARAEFVADHIALYSARASRGGGPYVVEARYPLTGA